MNWNKEIIINEIKINKYIEKLGHNWLFEN